MPPTVTRVDAAATRPLRQRVLRPHQTLDDLRYPGDDHPHTAHFAVLDDSGEPVAVASVYAESRPDGPAPGLRLRGMATDPVVRGSGLGGLVLAAAIEHARGTGTREVWCNARTPAAGFYERFGFERVGEEFESPGIGPHYLMRLAL